MRLLNTSTIDLGEFSTESLPEYVTLSHTWENDEVTSQDLTTPSERLHELAGYWKITACCDKPASEGFECAWVHTCCIDKTTSAELSEAINSMHV